MGKARCLAILKLTLDILYIVCVFAIYLTEVFVYMDKFHIGVYNVVKRDKYLDSDLYKEIDVNFRDFHTYLCDGAKGFDTKRVCDNKQHFEDAGILYITFTVISHFFAVYSVVGMIGIACGCSSLGVATIQVAHYIFPALHGASLTMYLTVSRIFNLTTPKGYSKSKYGSSVSIGFILMIVAQVLSVLSLIVFILSRRIFVLHTKIKPNSPKSKTVLRRKS